MKFGQELIFLPHTRVIGSCFWSQSIEFSNNEIAMNFFAPALWVAWSQGARIIPRRAVTVDFGDIHILLPAALCLRISPLTLFALQTPTSYYAYAYFLYHCRQRFVDNRQRSSLTVAETVFLHKIPFSLTAQPFVILCAIFDKLNSHPINFSLPLSLSLSLHSNGDERT